MDVAEIIDWMAGKTAMHAHPTGWAYSCDMQEDATEEIARPRALSDLRWAR